MDAGGGVEAGRIALLGSRPAGVPVGGAPAVSPAEQPSDGRRAVWKSAWVGAACVAAGLGGFWAGVATGQQQQRTPPKDNQGLGQEVLARIESGSFPGGASSSRGGDLRRRRLHMRAAQGFEPNMSPAAMRAARIIHRIRIAARIPHCELTLKTHLVQAK